MPQKGQILKDPATEDTYEYLELSKDTNGERMTMKPTLNKGQFPNHIHTLQDEVFEVLAGRLTIWADGKTQTLSVGQKMFLPKNKPHNHYNNDDEPVTFIQTVSPALDFEYWEENIIGLTTDGKIKNGKASFMQNVVTLRYLDSKTFLVNMPIPMQKFLTNLLGPIGRIERFTRNIQE